MSGRSLLCLYMKCVFNVASDRGSRPRGAPAAGFLEPPNLPSTSSGARGEVVAICSTGTTGAGGIDTADTIQVRVRSARPRPHIEYQYNMMELAAIVSRGEKEAI